VRPWTPCDHNAKLQNHIAGMARQKMLFTGLQKQKKKKFDQQKYVLIA